MTHAPCYTCTQRSMVCHAQCAAYHAWAAQVREEKHARRAAMDADAHTRITIDKMRKRRRKP